LALPAFGSIAILKGEDSGREKLLFRWQKSGIRFPTPPYKIEADGKLLHLFYYENILMWEEPPEKLLQRGLEGMLPLLPLTKGARETRQEPPLESWGLASL
jgi:hypothetical protein